MAELIRPSFDPQHYTFLAAYHPDDERAVEGLYYPYEYPPTHTEGMAIDVGVTPAAELPPKLLFGLGVNNFDRKVLILPSILQKGDLMMWFDVRTEGHGPEAMRRLRTAVWAMRAIANHHEDFHTYLEVTNGFVTSDVPDIWVPVPDKHVAVYDPSPLDDPEGVLNTSEPQEAEAGAEISSEMEGEDSTASPAIRPISTGDLQRR